MFSLSTQASFVLHSIAVKFPRVVTKTSVFRRPSQTTTAEMLSDELKRALERESTGYVTPGKVYGATTNIEAMQKD